jgi:type I restriction enzyme M protein
MLIKGEDFNKIKDPSSSLSDDQLHGKTFDYIISNPPYGTKWEKDNRKVFQKN